MKPLLTLSDVARELGMARSTLQRHSLFLKRLEARHPIGSHRYAGVLVEQVKQNKPLDRRTA